MKKLTLEEIKKRSLEKGFKFLDKKYLGSKHNHNFYCLKDKIIQLSTFNCINHGYGLNCCKSRKCKLEGVKQRKSLEEVKIISLEKGFIFLDIIYNGNKYKHNFYCLIDNEIHLATFNSISRNKKLICCKIRKAKARIGPLSSNWNPNLTEEERHVGRSSMECNRWKNGIKKKDKFECQICNSKLNLHAHHLESYASNKELRFDMNNGITLCQKHHNLFHREYGKVNNTKQQFKKFLNNLEYYRRA